MARVETIVVGGGINPGTPFGVFGIPYVFQVSPPLLATTDFLSVVPTGATRGLIVGLSDPSAAATERLRVNGGAIIQGTAVDSVVIGRGASAALGATDSVVIGRGAAAAGAGADCVIIGRQAVHTSGQASDVVIGAAATTSGGSGVCIGAAAKIADGGSASCVCIAGTINQSAGSHICIGGTINAVGGAVPASTVIGFGATGGDRHVTVGYQALGTGLTGIAVGYQAETTANGATALGFVAKASHAGAISLGSNAVSFQANTLVIGGQSSNQISTVVIGRGDTSSTPDAVLYRQTNGVGTDIAGGDMTHRPGVSSGNATPGKFVVSLGSAVAASGSTLQTTFAALTIMNNTGSVAAIIDTQVSTRNSQVQFKIATVDKGFLGVAGTANAFITGSAANDMCIRVQTANLLFSMNGGTTLHAAFSSAGVFSLNVDRGIRFNNQTSAAGASLGTLTNSPAVGDPTHWLKINIGGTNFAIPCWPG